MRRGAARGRDATVDLTNGPAKLCQALGITGADDGADLVTGDRGIASSTTATPPPDAPGGVGPGSGIRRGRRAARGASGCRATANVSGPAAGTPVVSAGGARRLLDGPTAAGTVSRPALLTGRALDVARLAALTRSAGDGYHDRTPGRATDLGHPAPTPSVVCAASLLENGTVRAKSQCGRPRARFGVPRSNHNSQLSTVTDNNTPCCASRSREPSSTRAGSPICERAFGPVRRSRWRV